MIDKASASAVADVGRSANSKLDEMIQRNQQFNKQLLEKRLTEAEIILDNEEKSQVIKLAAIEYLLKCKGMDSQQVEQSLKEIKVILGW